MKRVLAVIQIMRHTRNVGNKTTLAGAALGFKRGEETARFLETHRILRRQIKKRGLAYVGMPSNQGRSIETEEQVYRGAVSNTFIRRKITGGSSRQLPAFTDMKKTDLGLAQYLSNPNLLADSIEKLHRSEPQPHYAESIAEVKARVGLVKKLENAILQEKRRKGLNNPVLLFNLVTHSGYPRRGPIELIAEELTGKTIQALGGAFNHTEGIRRILYSDGSVATVVMRQNLKTKS